MIILRKRSDRVATSRMWWLAYDFARARGVNQPTSAMWADHVLSTEVPESTAQDWAAYLRWLDAAAEEARALLEEVTG